ncbi:MAG: energy transducer TonB [Flavobacteriaceae bacterium]|nr:MAG: energy transducer TonB [Flavobacteriaceae bacterium]
MQPFKKHPKKQLEKFSTIFMQLALVFVLFTTYVIIEHTSEQKLALAETLYQTTDPIYIEDNILPVVKEKKVKKAIAPKISKKAKKTVLHTIEKVPDITKIIETDLPDLVGEDTKIDNALNHFNPIGPIDSTEEDVPFIVIEDAPVFPGCKGNKKELKMCFNKKIQKHFARKFDTDLPDELGLSSGGKSVIMLFVIDKTGNIVNIQAKAPHPKLQKEAIRIMKLLPKMKPGMQRGNPVKVTYTLPMKVVVK